ncbi:hypothetical protein DVH07_06550 [Hafnia paralvei]|uniref:immunoglobulin domain-containing protein n=1 Tax=Hafnia paralvei TaxID=546367 RepID=UPI000DF18A01|nr:immunoglobulin domain-containing protein [Hafnia paralvei]RDA68355.1 hypothetical protein DU449_07860 [Hafnia paralvei]RDA69394.1 hypothetical protein DVH09_08455 [Hafnia paralvei]RDA69555.1 hypothetical protein DVH08_09450 [Hafnia paralvei]RDA79598.1 hypothetical protein DVH10_06840 [Hafnia paralvei]RDA80135.1 hypothetical protein DVH07_06550 [Hafnia paralvei]
MAICQTDNSKLFGRAIVLEVADGCADTAPLESEWKALAAGTSKGFDFSPNTVTSDADDTKGYVENIVTNSDFTISFEGEVRKNDKLDQYGIGNFIKYYNTEIKAARQPTLWVRMEYGPVTFVGYMVITALSSDGGTNDIVTFTTEFKVADADTVQVNDTSESMTLTTDLPAAKTISVGSALNMSVVAAGGTTPYTYVWKKDGTAVSGQSSATFNKASATSGDAGSYVCVASDSATPPASITSSACVVTVS